MTFAEWWGFQKERPGCGGAENRERARDAWNAACEACARAQHAMLRDMTSRGQAAENCRALRAEPLQQDNG